MSSPPRKKRRVPSPSSNSYDRKYENIKYSMKRKLWMQWGPKEVNISKRLWAPCPYMDRSEKRSILRDFFTESVGFYEGGIYIKAFSDWQFGQIDISKPNEITKQMDSLKSDDGFVESYDTDEPFETVEAPKPVETETIEDVKQGSVTKSIEIARILDVSSIYFKNYLGLFYSSEQPGWMRTPFLFDIVDDHVKFICFKGNDRLFRAAKEGHLAMKKSDDRLWNHMWKFYVKHLSTHMKGYVFHENEEDNVKFYLATFFCVMRLQKYKIGQVSFNGYTNSKAPIIRRLGQYETTNETFLKAYRFKIKRTDPYRKGGMKRVWRWWSDGHEEQRAINTAVMECIENKYHRIFAKEGRMMSNNLDDKTLRHIFTEQHSSSDWVGEDGKKIKKYQEYVYGIDDETFLNHISDQCDKLTLQLQLNKEDTTVLMKDGRKFKFRIEFEKVPISQPLYDDVERKRNWHVLKNTKIVDYLKRILNIKAPVATNLDYLFQTNLKF